MPSGCARLLAGEKETVDLPGGPWRALYVWRGSAGVSGRDGAMQTVEAGTGIALGRDGCRIVPGDRDCRFFVWEVDRGTADGFASLQGLAEMLKHDLPALPGESDEDAGTACLRLERVDLTLGVETPLHTHAGSGLRVLLGGHLDARVGDAVLDLGPGDAWLERGPGEPVVGRASADEETSFVRLMVLPAAMAGRDSFIFLDARDVERPRPASYRRYFEERTTI
jgi:hypothetical protein